MIPVKAPSAVHLKGGIRDTPLYPSEPPGGLHLKGVLYFTPVSPPRWRGWTPYCSTVSYLNLQKGALMLKHDLPIRSGLHDR